MKIVLTVDNKHNPIQLTSLTPKFSFYFEGNEAGVQVDGFTLIVAEDAKFERKVWDSGKIESGLTQNIAYNGKPLSYDCTYFVKAEVLTNKGTVFGSAHFTTPIAGFDAPWITTQNKPRDSEAVFCYNFDLQNKPIAKAALYATALGVYEAHINGKRIGDGILSPGFTDYSQYVCYDTYDVSDAVRGGKNAICMYTGKGWFCGHIFLQNGWFGKKVLVAARLDVVYEDGTTQTVATNADWKCAPKSPFISCDNNMGETYDARLYKDFSDADCDIASFEQAVLANDGNATLKGFLLSGIKVFPRIEAPVQILDELHPVSVNRESGKKTWVVDFGQNFAGFVKAKLRAPKNAKITIRHAEILCEKNGKEVFYTDNLRTAKATDVYYKATDGEEEYRPTFTFHGFRYAEVSGVDDLTAADIVGLPIGTKQERTGYLETSNAKVNRFYENVIWSQLSNFISIPTDCPQRDERMGWTGDAGVFVNTACYNFDSKVFLEKYEKDMLYSQAHAIYHAYTQVAPYVVCAPLKLEGIRHKETRNSPAWGDAGLIIAESLYDRYGDKRVLEDNYSGFVNWVNYCKSMAEDGLIRGMISYGDWLSVQNTPKVMTNTAIYANSIRIMVKVSKALGKNKEAEEYAKLLKLVKTAYNKKFITKDYKILGDTQTGYALTLAYGLVDDEDGRKMLAKRLAANVQKNGYHLTCGFIGVAKLCPMLCDYGYDDIAYKLLLQEGYPSWLYMVKMGATTIWERWNSKTEHSLGNISMNSYNHYSLGAVAEWMYAYMAGISSDDGYRTVKLCPHINSSLGYVKASYRSPYGNVCVKWSVSDKDLCYNVSLAPNTVGKLSLRIKGNVTVNGAAIDKADGISDLQIANGVLTATLASGSYEVKGEYIACETEDITAYSFGSKWYLKHCLLKSERMEYKYKLLRRLKQWKAKA